MRANVSETSFQTFVILPQGNQFSYAPSDDGQRFVMNAQSTPARPTLDLILNWGQTQSRQRGQN
jgi:hypothetical protein